MYGWGRYAGFGTLDYYGLLAQANLQDCASNDSTCVSNNVAKEAAVEDLWASTYQKTGAPDDLKLTFTPQTQAEVREFYNPQDLFNSGNVVDERGIMSVSQGGKTAAYVPPVSTTPPPPAAKVPAKTADGKAIVNSSGASDTAVPFTLPTVGGFTVPWWGWLAGAGVAVFALKGGR